MSELSVPERLRLWAEQNQTAASRLVEVLEAGGGRQIYVPLISGGISGRDVAALRAHLLSGNAIPESWKAASNVEPEVDVGFSTISAAQMHASARAQHRLALRELNRLSVAPSHGDGAGLAAPQGEAAAPPIA